jgi:hypothetical protein
MTLSSLMHYLWTTRFLLQAALLAWMMVRHFYRDFPIFVWYTGEKVLQTIVLQAMIYSPSVTGPQYTMAFAVGTVLGWGLSFALIYELFQQAFHDYPALRNLGTTLFRGTTVFCLLVGVGLAWAKPAAELNHLMSKLDLVEQTVCVMQGGLVIVLLLLSKKLGLSLQSHTFGIALGSGILASVNLAAFAIRSHVESGQATPAANLLNLISVAAGLCSVVVWAAYVIRPETLADSPSRVLPNHNLESWNQELRRLLR